MENSTLLYWHPFKRSPALTSLAKKESEVHDAVSSSYLNRPICKEMFLNLYGISYSRFRRLKEHYEEHGICQRVYGNSKRLPHNTLSQAVTEDVRNFLTNYVEENAVVLPGRIPGFKNDAIRLLSSSDTKNKRVACI